jgi:hypothetical protein
MPEQENLLVEKTTIVKNNETLKIKAVPFAKGHRLELQLALNPDISVDLDKVLLPLEKSVVRQAVAGMTKIVEAPLSEGGLGSHIIVDE